MTNSRRPRCPAPLLALLALVPLLTYCGGGGGDNTVAPPPAITSVSVAPTSVPLLGVGSSATLSASIAPSNATGAIAWRSDNTSIATVSGSGSSATITAVGAGATTVVATAGGISGSAAITVTPIVRGITPSRSIASVLVGATTALSATLNADVGASIALTWSTSQSAIAAVDANGLVSGVAPGVATITVASAGFPAINASIVVTVAYPVVRGVVVTPNAPTVLIGASRQLSATLDVDAGTPTSVTWTSATPAVAQVGASGLVTAIAAGSAVVRATSTANPTVSGSVTVTVSAPTVRSITLSPTAPSAIVGGTQQFSLAIDADAGANSGVTWSSSNTAVATVSSTGLVSALSPGASVIRATSVLVTTVSAQTTITVSAPPVLNAWQQRALSPLTSAMTADLSQSWSVNNSLAFATGFGSDGEQRVLKWDGSVWSFLPLAPFDNITAVGGPGGASTEAYIGNASGRIAQYTTSVAANPGFVEMSVPTVSCIKRIVPAGAGAVVALASTSTSCAGRPILTYSGTVWTRLPDPTQLTQVNDVAATSTTDIVAVGLGGTGIQRWNGATWSAVAAPPTVGIAQSVARLGSDIVVVTGAAESARLTGATWTAISAPTPRPNAGGLFLTSLRVCGGQLYVGTTFDGRVFRLDGTSWTEIAGYGVAAAGTYTTQATCGADNTLRAVGADASVGRYTGSAWVWETYTPWLFHAKIVRADLAYAVGGHGAIERWDGSRWQLDKAVSSFGALNSLAATSDGLVLAAGPGGPTGVWRKSANTWTFDALAGAPNALWANSSTFALSLNSGGTAARFDGASWQSVTAPGGFTAAAMDGSASDFALAVGNLPGVGAAFRWNGSAWTSMSFPNTPGFFFDVRVVSSALAYAVTGQAIYRWDGAQWNTMPAPSALLADQPFRSVAATSANDVYVLSASGPLFHYDGTSWSRVATFSTTPGVFPYYTSIDISSTGVGLVAGFGGAIYHGAVGAAVRIAPLRRK